MRLCGRGLHFILTQISLEQSMKISFIIQKVLLIMCLISSYNRLKKNIWSSDLTKEIKMDEFTALQIVQLQPMVIQVKLCISEINF